MTNGYISFQENLPPVNTPIICLAYKEDMSGAAILSCGANVMSKAVVSETGDVFHHPHSSSLGKIEGRLMAWKRCWW